MIKKSLATEAGPSIEYRLTRSKRKTIAIYVSSEGVEVRVPYQVSARQAHEFVCEKQHWIEKQLSTIAARPQSYQPQWRWGSQHYFLGEPQLLDCHTGQNADYLLNGKPSDSAELVKRQIQRWYRQQAQQVFSERHQFWCVQLADMGFPDSYIEPRMMKRRWGSCRPSGKITLNTNLVKYPLQCIDVVIVHELCHLHEFNHSPRFYALMSRALPQWKRFDQMLNELSLQY